MASPASSGLADACRIRAHRARPNRDEENPAQGEQYPARQDLGVMHGVVRDELRGRGTGAGQGADHQVTGERCDQGSRPSCGRAGRWRPS